MGESLFSLTRTLARSILEPVLGRSTLDKAESVVGQAGQRSMSLLSFVDDQLYALGERVETCFNSALSVASAPVRQFGSASADVSSDSEEPLRRNSDTITRLINLLVYIISYAFGVASAWLLQHSQVEDKQATADDEDEDHQHSYVKSKLPAEDHQVDKPDLVEDFVKEKVDDLKEQDFVKEKVIDDVEPKKQQQDEADELTKLFDATWSLGSL